MFDLVRLSKLRVAFLRNGVIGVGETNIVNTGFVEGRAVDRTADILTAVAQLLDAAPPGALVSVELNGVKRYLTLQDGSAQTDWPASWQGDGSEPPAND